MRQPLHPVAMALMASKIRAALNRRRKGEKTTILAFAQPFFPRKKIKRKLFGSGVWGYIAVGGEQGAEINLNIFTFTRWCAALAAATTTTTTNF